MDRFWESHYPEGVDYHREIKGSLIHEMFEEAVKEFPKRCYMDFLGKELSYEETLDLVNQVAAGLQKMGVKKGVHVGLFLPNTPAYPIFCFGILKAGGTIVNFNVLGADEEVVKQAKNSNIDFMVTHDVKMLTDKVLPLLDEIDMQKLIIVPLRDCMPYLKGILAKIFKRSLFGKIPKDDRIIYFKEMLGDPAEFVPPVIEVKDVAFLQYTGGTTGGLKGAMLSHENISTNAKSAMRMLAPSQKRGEARFLAVLPFFHIFGLTGGLIIMTSLAAKMVFLFPRFDVDQAIDLIRSHKITFMGGVPTLYLALSNHPEAKEALQTVRVCISGGDSLPITTKEAFESVAPCSLVEGYGLTEASPILTMNPPTGVQKNKSCGLPIPGLEVGILDLQTRTEFLGPNQKGEICVRGPNVMLGYYQKPEQSKEVMYKGFLRTGDIGYMDEDGYVFLIDREKDLVIVSGYNVYPRDVQDQIAKHPSVAEVCAVGVPDSYRNRHMKAYIVLKEGHQLTGEELETFLTSKLSPIEMPKEFEFRKELPKTLIGKISKKDLVEEELRKLGSREAA